MTDRLVFDTEPLVAHATSEAGAEVVDDHFVTVADGDVEGWISVVTLTEFHYVLARKHDRETADFYLARLDDLGVQYAYVDRTVWMSASEFVLEHNPALGDAFALAAAEALEATLLVGDDDYDGITEVPIEHFRDGHAPGWRE